MRAVILAAGCGTRLASIGWDKPKCLLPVGGRTLLERCLAVLKANGINEAVVVVGYRRELIETAVRQSPAKCHVVFNRDFATTNTIHSLWLARDFLADGFIYFNGDVLFDRRIVELSLTAADSTVAVASRTCAVEEVKVMVDENLRVIRIGKHLAPGRCLGESVGIIKFAPSACPAMIDALTHFNEITVQRGLFFESALDVILDQHPFRAVPLGELRAIEIDTPGDYDAAKEAWESGEGE